MISYRPNRFQVNGFQVTLARAVEYSGPGLHCGKHVNMRILPAPPGSGIRFVRADIPGSPVILARPENVVPSARCTAIGDAGGHGRARVDTVEHIMAAFRGLGVDNAIVELDGPEVPMGDGSAAIFVELIRQAGRARQEERRRSLVLESPVWVSEGDKHLIVLPYGRDLRGVHGYHAYHGYRDQVEAQAGEGADAGSAASSAGGRDDSGRGSDPGRGMGLKITFTFVTKHPAVGTQHVEFELNGEDGGGLDGIGATASAGATAGVGAGVAAGVGVAAGASVIAGPGVTVGTGASAGAGDGAGDDSGGGAFARELAPARTVGFTWEIARLREAGLALGGDPGSAVVIGEDGYLGPLRFEDEVARHKVLDIVGDFALLGHVSAHIIGIKSNHAMNHRAVRIIAGRLSE